MDVLNQRQGVYIAVMNYLADKNIPFDDGQMPAAAELLSSSDRKNVVNIVACGLLSGEISMSLEAKTKRSTPQGTAKYATELVSNWLRKDERLNGGSKPSIKSPVPTGKGDAELRELQKLRALKMDDAEALEVIDDAISKRRQAIGQAKAKTVVVNANLIPEHLRHLV